MITMRDVYTGLTGVVIGGLIVATGCAVLKLRSSLPSVAAVPAKELAGEKTTKLECKPVLIYRDKLKDKLGIPDPVKSDPKTHITASANIPVSVYPRTATSVYNEETGSTSIFLRTDRLPWLATASRGSVVLHWGAQEDGTTTTRLSASYSALQVKRINLGLSGDISTSGRAFVGVGGEVRF